MRNARNRSFFFPVITCTLLLIGCAAGPPLKSGFLGTYEGFKPHPEYENVLWWEKKPGAIDPDRYTKLMIDPIVIFLNPDGKQRSLRPDELKKLADTFREVLIEELEDAYPLVDKPGADVLRVRIALTDIIPATAMRDPQTGLKTGMYVNMGGAVMEAEFLDSEGSKRLAAVIARKTGTSKEKGYLEFTEFGGARRAFKEWARALRKSLDGARKR